MLPVSAADTDASRPASFLLQSEELGRRRRGQKNELILECDDGGIIVDKLPRIRIFRTKSKLQSIVGRPERPRNEDLFNIPPNLELRRWANLHDIQDREGGGSNRRAARWTKED